MELALRWSHIAYRIVVVALIAIIAVTSFLLARSVFFPKVTTPRTALERAYLDALAVVKANPRNARSRLKLAMAYAAAGRNNNALSQLEVALKLDPVDPEVYYGLGLVYKQVGQPRRAIKALERAVKLEGSVAELYREAYYELGQIYYAQKNYKKAVKAFEGAVDNGPEATYILMALAKSYEKAGQKEKAVEEYREILLYLPDYKPAKDAITGLTSPASEKEKAGSK